jgi:peptidyl-prolyl cis-trans isomerase D
MKTVLKAAFDANQNETTRVSGIQDTAIFAVHVDKVIAPQLKPIGEVKDRVVAAWEAQEKRDAAKKTADAIEAAVKGGTPLDKAAADNKLKVTTSPPLARRPDASAPVPAAVVVKLFSAKVGDIVSASDAAGAYVARLAEIKVPDTTPEEQAAALSTELSNAARYDMVGEFTEALKKRFPVTIHRDALDRLF